MNKFLILALRITSGPAIAVTTALAGDVLSNPGFEYDTTTLPGWTEYGVNAFSETSATPAHSGTNYLKVYQAFNGQVNYTGIYQDYISGPGATYTADGWAYILSTDKPAGQDIAWIEVTFRDANAHVLALYRTASITTNVIATEAFPVNTWIDLPITNQYNPNTYVITNTIAQLVAPAGTYFVRYQVVFQGDALNSGGSVYFDDLNLAPVRSTPYGNWNITWSDEFNGPNINTNTWTYDTGNGGSNPGWGNNELEYYTSRTNNACVSGGLLHIVARQESYSGFNYTSARMKSQGLFSAQYGRLEWRAKLSSGVGSWPALWLLGTNIGGNIPWPGCGEIDVVENKGSTTGTVQGSLHSGSDETGYYNFLNGDSVTNFHTYTLDWSSNAIMYYVDGHLYQTQTNWTDSSGTYPFPFNQPFFFIMNLAIGGKYLGNPSTNVINADTAFPIEMQVDYVRIYNMTDPLLIAIEQTNSNVLLSWPGNIVCHVQAQTNLLTSGLGTGWFSIVPTNSQTQIEPENGSRFYRLVSP